MNWGGAPPRGLGEWKSSSLWTSGGQGRERSGWLLGLSQWGGGLSPTFCRLHMDFTPLNGFHQ